MVQPNMTPIAKRHIRAWLLYAILGVLLALGLYFMVAGWSVSDDAGGAPITTNGYIAMGVGIVFTLALGIGLMTLMFYSNRKGHD
jgi:Zn-dependent protease with chaperone function